MAAIDLHDQEISILDLVQTLWRKKLIVAAFFAASMPLAYFATFLLPDTAKRTVEISIYPSGTPTDTAVEVADQLIRYLEKFDYTPMQDSRTGKVSVDLAYKRTSVNAADKWEAAVRKTITAFETRMDAKANGAYFDFRNSLKGLDPAAAVEPFLRFQSYQTGRNDGLIDLVRANATDADPFNRLYLATLVGVPLLGTGIGIAFSLALATLQSWRER